MKLKYILPIAIATAAMALTTGANADTTSVITFGRTNGVTSPIGVTWNQVATSNNGSTIPNVSLLDASGNSTGLTLDGGVAGPNGTYYSAGAGGSFMPSGTTAYDNSNAVVNSWITPTVGYDYQAQYGNIWQNLANGSNSTGGGPGQTETNVLTLSGLAANTTYKLTLLSARANPYETSNGTYGLLYNGSATGVTTTLSPNSAGTIAGSTVTTPGAGSGAGLNASEITWSFNSGATPGNATLSLGGGWNANALLVSPTAVPEPSTVALAMIFGVGMLFFFRRRRIA